MSTFCDDFDCEAAARVQSQPIDPVITAADIVVAEALRADPSLRRRCGQGVVTVLHAPSAAWCEPLTEAWCAAVLDGHVPARHRNQKGRESHWHEEVATEPRKRSSKQADEASAALVQQETLTGEEAALVIAEARRPAARIVGDRVQAGEETMAGEVP